MKHLARSKASVTSSTRLKVVLRHCSPSCHTHKQDAPWGLLEAFGKFEALGDLHEGSENS